MSVIRAWRDDDGEMRVPDTEWGYSFVAAIDALLASDEAQAQQIAAALTLHERYKPLSIPAYCNHDLLRWPCPTARALGVTS